MNLAKSITTFLHKISKPYVSRRVVARLGAAFMLLIVPLAIFAELADDVRDKEPIGFDAAIQAWTHSLSAPWLDVLLALLTQLGGVMAIVVIAAGLVLILLSRGRQRMASIVLFGVGGAAVINTILKLIFERTRPDVWEHLVVEHSYSFPSGHAMASSALALAVIAITWRTRWRWLTLVAGSAYVILIGFSRVYLGVHYPSDIVAGWCISLAWVAMVALIINRYRRQRLASHVI